jgi:tartrate dehydrogenase/decarboxylase/D-malate dehydrogenase
MKRLKIAVIPGDGIGNEVMKEGIKVLEYYQNHYLDVAIQFDYFPWGCEYYLKHQLMMPDDALTILKDYDAILLGAVGYPGVADHISLRGLLLKIRQGFNQSVNLRPIKLLKGAPCPLVNKGQQDIDFVVIRENVEGEYAGVGEFRDLNTENAMALQTGVFTKKNTDKIMHYAFELACKRNKYNKVTSVTKSNALNYSMVFWDQLFHDMSKRYPTTAIESHHVDAICMYFVQKPERYDVVVASNLFGDIITDLGAALQGGLGFAASANLNLEGDYPSMFEPVHGSAPEIAGKNIANPIAMIWTIKMMLDHLFSEIDHSIILNAVEMVLENASILTPDLGGHSKTHEVGDAIISALKRLTVS